MQGSDERPPVAPSESIDSLVAKRISFLKVKEWEAERSEKMLRFLELLTPLLEDLSFVVERGRESMSHLIRFLTEYSKLQQDMFPKVRSAAKFKGSLSDALLSAAFPSADAESPPPAEDTPDRSQPPGKPRYFQSYPQPWAEALAVAAVKEASLRRGFGAWVAENLIPDQLAKHAAKFERNSGGIMGKLRLSRQRFSNQLRDVSQCWTEYERVYRAVEKWDYDNKVDRATNEFKDCWIVERKYLITASAAVDLQKDFFSVMKEEYIALRQLEEWRSRVVRIALTDYLTKANEANDGCRTSLISAHAMIDPEGCSVPSSPPLSAPPETERRRDTKEESAAATEIRLGLDGSGPSSPEDLEESPTPSEPISTTMDAASELLFSDEAPQSCLVVKRGFVKRQKPGLQGKWQDGMMVLTWDRFLHMFRSHDDPTPVWSVCIHFQELRLIEERGAPVTFELRERRPAIIMGSHRKNLFRCYSDAEVQEWLEILELACTADDATFTRTAAPAAVMAALPMRSSSSVQPPPPPPPPRADEPTGDGIVSWEDARRPDRRHSLGEALFEDHDESQIPSSSPFEESRMESEDAFRAHDDDDDAREEEDARLDPSVETDEAAVDDSEDGEPLPEEEIPLDSPIA
eukprot:Polyplicarium_translucidae@DN3057_c0_g1_i3.p1